MAIDEVQDIVTVSDAAEIINVTESQDNISVTQGSDGEVTVSEIVEVYALQDQNDTYSLTDSPDQVTNISDASVIIQKTIIVEPDDTVPLSVEVDFVGTSFIYKGWAEPGSLTSDPLWKMQRIEFVGADEDIVIRWAASGLYTQIWDNRLALTYT